MPKFHWPTRTPVRDRFQSSMLAMMIVFLAYTWGGKVIAGAFVLAGVLLWLATMGFDFSRELVREEKPKTPLAFEPRNDAERGGLIDAENLIDDCAGYTCAAARSAAARAFFREAIDIDAGVSPPQLAIWFLDWRMRVVMVLGSALGPRSPRMVVDCNRCGCVHFDVSGSRQCLLDSGHPPPCRFCTPDGARVLS